MIDPDDILWLLFSVMLGFPVILGISIISNIIVWVPTSIAIIKCLQYLNIIGG